MKNRKWIIVPVALLLLLVLPCAHAQNTDKREVLRGIKSLSVLIQEIHPEAIKMGLTESIIRTDVELKLRMVGINVLSPQENQLGLRLNVAINIAPGPDIPLYPISINISIKEYVLSLRNLDYGFLAQIWNKGLTGIYPRNELASGVRNGVKTLTDIFLNDYLAVNPKH